MKTELSGHVVSMKFFKKIAIQEIVFMILNSVFLYVSWRKEINVKRFLKLVMIFVQPIYHVLTDTARTLDSVTNKIPIDFSETDSYRKWLFTVQVDDGPNPKYWLLWPDIGYFETYIGYFDHHWLTFDNSSL